MKNTTIFLFTLFFLCSKFIFAQELVEKTVLIKLSQDGHKLIIFDSTDASPKYEVINPWELPSPSYNIFYRIAYDELLKAVKQDNGDYKASLRFTVLGKSEKGLTYVLLE